MKTYAVYRFPVSVTKPLSDTEKTDVAKTRDDTVRALDDGPPPRGNDDDAEEAGRKVGHAQGWKTGYDEGVGMARADIGAALRDQYSGHAEVLDAAIHTALTFTARCRATRRDEIVGLVQQVARQVLRSELAARPAQLVVLVDEALAALPPSPGRPIIYFHPDDCASMALLHAEYVDRWSVVADAMLRPGDCRIEAGAYEADAGCAFRLEACIDQIADYLGTPRP